jgi:hypothetical protein
MVRYLTRSKEIEETLDGLAERDAAVAIFRVMQKTPEIGKTAIRKETGIGEDTIRRYVADFVGCMVIEEENTFPKRYKIRTDMPYYSMFAKMVEQSKGV